MHERLVRRSRVGHLDGDTRESAECLRERGRPPVTREAFDAARGPDGAMFVGDSDTVAARIVALSETLGGLARVSIQMTNSGTSHETLMYAIELLGTRVAPAVRSATAPAMDGSQAAA